MKKIFQYITKFYERLNTRERAILIFGAIVAIAIIAYGTVIGPLSDRYTTLLRMTTQKEEQYKNMLQLKEEYTVLKKEYTELEKGASRTKEGFTPLTFMENVSTQARIRDRVVSMKPRVMPIGDNFRESSIEVKIEKVVLEQITSYLHLIESSVYPLKIRTMHLKSRYDDPGMMDASITVSFFEKVK